ncbi:hypothetical protein D3C72_1212050 [compost metagenome]
MLKSSIGVRSWMRMPMASATRRSPRTSLPGCTVAAIGEYTPARLRAEPERRATSSGGSAWYEWMPRASSACIIGSSVPICACEVAV